MITFISILCGVFLFARAAEPIQMVKRFFTLDVDAQHTSRLHKFFIDLLNCSLCVGFWVGLYIYLSLDMACLVAVCSEMLTRLINRI